MSLMTKIKLKSKRVTFCEAEAFRDPRTVDTDSETEITELYIIDSLGRISKRL